MSALSQTIRTAGKVERDAAGSPRGHRPGQGRLSRADDDRGARPGSGRGSCAGPSLRCVPHRPALPRRRHRRRLPVPARARGGGSRGGGWRRGHGGCAGRLRHLELAGGVRPVPRLPSGQALVLLRHAQRGAADDSRGRHRAVGCAGHRCVRREDARPCRSVHQGGSRRAGYGGRSARLRGHGGTRSRGEHRWPEPRRLDRGDRLRRRRRGRDPREHTWPALQR